MLTSGLYDATLFMPNQEETMLSEGKLPACIKENLQESKKESNAGEESVPGYKMKIHTGKQKGTVIIVPGGGYHFLSDREAEPIQRAFTKYGFRSLIFSYDVTSSVLLLRPLQQLAWGVAKTKSLYPDEPVYLCGFSAGAHLALSLGVHFDDTDWNEKPVYDEVETFLETDTDFVCHNTRKNAIASSIYRPDGIIAVYPVVTGYEHAHEGSFTRLLGERKDAGKHFASLEEYDRARRWFSLETAVKTTTPPCYIWQTEQDDHVPVENSLAFITSMLKHRIPIEYHIFPKGLHGLSLATPEVEEPDKHRYTDLHVAKWFEEAIDWLLYQ